MKRKARIRPAKPVQDPMRTEEPYYRGLLLLPLKHINSPFIVRNKNGYEDGPCELAFRNDLEMPMIETLSEELRYMIGVAVRYIGFSLDMVGLSVTEAEGIHGDLCESIALHMTPANSSEPQPFTVDTLVVYLLEKHGYLYSDQAAAFRESVHKYVHKVMTANYERGGPPRAWDIEAAAKELFDVAPSIHVRSHVYDQCERGDWTAFQTDRPLLPAPVFKLIVDDETWLQAGDNPMICLQTDWLILDARRKKWKCYERIRLKGLDVPPKTDITLGAWYESKTGGCGPIESQTYLPFDGAYHSFTSNTKEASRMFHVIGSLMLLLQHGDVYLNRQGNCDWVLTIPDDRSVDSLIADVLKPPNSEETA